MKKTLLIIVGLSSMLSADFTRDTSTEIVTDNSTNLVWQDAVGSTTTWQGAIDQCEGSSFGGHEDWRLPNITELTSLVDDAVSSPPTINATFQNTASDYYWSSTTDTNAITSTWILNFNNGMQYSGSKHYTPYYVRCVRAGQ